jgi:hypothetical protein
MFHPGGQVPFWILATDYHRYCVIYGCRDVRKDGTCLKNQTNFLVMSRNQTLDEVNSRIRQMNMVNSMNRGALNG